jgi:transposase
MWDLRSQMTEQPEAIAVLDIDHLGIVAGIIDQMGLVEQVNQIVGTTPQEKVSPGHILKAMILNGLGFVSAPLYLFEQFFVGKATEHLIGKGVRPEHLNDDRLGRTLDKFYQVGITQLFTQIALKTVEQFQIKINSAHLDSSSIHVDGEYLAGEEKETLPPASEQNNQEKSTSSPEEVDSEPKPIVITHGYSRDHRPDLKQFIIDTICTSDGDIPLYLRVANGNEDDKAVFAKLFQEFRQQWKFDGICVADAALYTANNIQAMSSMKWLTRVPLTIKEAGQALLAIEPDEWINTSLDGYRIAERNSQYAGVEQRWLIVESEPRKKSDIIQLHKKVAKQQQQLEVKLRQLSSLTFACQPDAQTAVEKFANSLKYHCLQDIKFIEQAHYPKSGRPRKSTQPNRVSYRIEAHLVTNQAVIAAEMSGAGRFILATNVLDMKELSAESALREYKEQQANERGFRFLKDPLFFTSSVFVKTAERVEAIAMVMAISLLVYTLAQRQLRQALEQSGETIKNQVGKLTNRPTMRWVFQCFQSVHLLIIDGRKQVTNLSLERQKILSYLGSFCSYYYLFT